MSEDTRGPRSRFVSLPRAGEDPAAVEVARRNFIDGLDAIAAFLAHTVDGGREAFTRNSPAYATGSMAIIRAAALFEVEEFAPFLRSTSEESKRAMVTMRNIASHSGYRAMNDDIFWTTLTVHLPPHLEAWRDSANDRSA